MNKTLKIKEYKIILLIILFFLIGSIIGYQYPTFLDAPKTYVTGIIHLIFPEQTNRPEKNNYEYKFKETIFANAFNLKVQPVEYLSIRTKLNNDSTNYQHRSSALYAETVKGKTYLRLFTRDGHEISKDGIKKYKLPSTYHSHNSHGGLRGIFFFENEPYGFMVAKTVGCQYVSIVNLNLSREIFRTDCLPDYRKIHYNSIGGASLHFKDKILLTIGVPTNDSQSIRNLAQDEKSYFGKIISISKNNLKKIKSNKEIKLLKPEIISIGHRNPQGLAKINNIVFSAEHGPKGGDEINNIKFYQNYGWPVSSYGTKYDSFGEENYKAYKNSHKKYGFTEPLFQFTPSIAISSLAKCPNKLQEYYEREGCLIATSLKNRSLYIIILNDELNRVIGFEKILLKERLRHFAKDLEGNLFYEDDGSIYVTIDNNAVLKVSFIFKKFSEN